MLKFLLALLILVAAVLLIIRRARRESIVGTKSRNKYFASLARQLGFARGGDDYFIQVEGTWKGTPVIIYPHNFHGPGSITLFYADTGVPLKERTWIEPTLSLGRAIVDWKQKIPFHHEFSGDPSLHQEKIVSAVRQCAEKFPFVAITQPTRFIFSHYLMQSLGTWKHFVILLVLDAGRKPSMDEIHGALDAACELAEVVRSSQS